MEHLAFHILFVRNLIDDAPLLAPSSRAGHELVERERGGGLFRLPFPPDPAPDHVLNRMARKRRERGSLRVPGPRRLHEADEAPGDEILPLHRAHEIPLQIAVDLEMHELLVLAHQSLDFALRSYHGCFPSLSAPCARGHRRQDGVSGGSWGMATSPPPLRRFAPVPRRCTVTIV